MLATPLHTALRQDRTESYTVQYLEYLSVPRQKQLCVLNASQGSCHGSARSRPHTPKQTCTMPSSQRFFKVPTVCLFGRGASLPSPACCPPAEAAPDQWQTLDCCQWRNRCWETVSCSVDHWRLSGSFFIFITPVSPFCPTHVAGKFPLGPKCIFFFLPLLTVSEYIFVLRHNPAFCVFPWRYFF